MPSRTPIAVAAVIGASFAACSDRADPSWHVQQGYRWATLSPGFPGRTGFSPVAPSRSGIIFENRLSTDEIAANRHYLNGSGVAAGDIDGDGRVDLYFAGMSGPGRLYRNLGGLAFEDVTDAAGLAHPPRYSTGVVLADVDQDRDLDLLIGSIHDGVILYRNVGSGRFRRGSDSGLDRTSGKGNSTLALADIDGDGDLDLYVTNYRERSINDLIELRELTWEKTVQQSSGANGAAYVLRPPFEEYFTLLEREGLPPERREIGERDQLFVNDGHGRFVEVAGHGNRFLSADGGPRELERDWGLTAKFQDLNHDHLPDLYVANDFWTPDRVWINQGGGVFGEIDPVAIRNLSFSAMAVDFSDVNRDGALDIFVTEMLSPLRERRARHVIPKGPFPNERFRIDGQPQYNRNSLYMNRGDGTYAETSHYSGVAASGWSWAAQFIDVDLDGFEDLIVTTGFSHDLQDLDTQLRVSREVAAGTRPSRGQLAAYPPLELANRAFRNNGDLTFSDVSADWGFRERDISHGLALADFDNDGDLDVAINRLGRVATIYQNTTRERRIAVRLVGRAANVQAIGAQVALEGGPAPQSKEVASGGGYVSGSDPLIAFAAGKGDHALTVRWPGGAITRIDDLRANRLYEIHEPVGGRVVAAGVPLVGERSTVFADVSDRIDHRHHEQPFDSWRIQPLLPVDPSRQGPGVSWIDFDGDGDDDLFIGAGRGGRLGAFENRGDGRFAPVELGALTQRAPGDQTTLLGWRADAGTAFVLGSANLEQGNVGAPAAFHFSRAAGGVIEEGRVPDNTSTTGPLAAADVDGDGDLDLFVGGRFMPAQHPLPATSRLFRNERGRFVADDANASVLSQLGLVSAAVFTDFDQDGDPDLLLARVWDSLKLLRNERGTFRDVTDAVGLARYAGWWNGVATGDFNGDGRPDIVATNLGTNSPYRPDSRHPPRIYYHDFNWDGRVDILEAYYDAIIGDYVPRRRLHAYESIANLVLSNVRSHADFAKATLADVLGHRASSTPSLEISILEHTVFLNDGDHFSARALPRQAQLSAAFGVAVADYDADGREDVFIGQNLYHTRPDLPRLDGGRGLWLKGDGRGDFEPVPGHVSGVTVYGEGRGAALADFDADGRVDLAVAQNGEETKLYLNRSERSGLRVRLVGPTGNRDGIGTTVRLVYEDGTKGPAREVQAGSGYWSQNSATQVLGASPGMAVDHIEVTWFDGSIAAIPVSREERTYVIGK